MKFEAAFRGQTYLIEISAGVKVESGAPFTVTIHTAKGTKSVPVRVLDKTGERWTLEIDGRIRDIVITGSREEPTVHFRSHAFPVAVRDFRDQLAKGSLPEAAGRVSITAHMPGKIISVLVSEGEEVKSGQGLVVIEAMKMQNELQSPKSGRVIRASAREGDRVNAGAVLFEIE